MGQFAKLSILFLFLSCVLGCQNDTKAPHSNAVVTPSEVKITTNNTLFIGSDFLLDDQHSYIGFKIKYFGFSPVRGRFDRFNGIVFYDPENIDATTMNAIIWVNSINTGNETRDADLITETAWFNEAEYPFITFQSKSATENPDGSFILNGILSLNGITKEIAIPFDKPTAVSRDWAFNEQVDYSARFTLKRKDYEVHGGDFWDSIMENGLTQLSDEVEIELDLHTRRADYKKRYADLEEENVRKIVLDTIKSEGIAAGISYIDFIGNTPDSPFTVGAFSTISNTLISWDMYAEARSIIEKALQWYPESASLYNQLGVVHLKLGSKEEARKNFEKAAKFEPDNAKSAAYLDLFF